MKTVGITGGTGFVGRHLAKLLKEKGYKIVIFTTHPEKEHHGSGYTYSYWDPRNNKCDLIALKQLDAVVHLAGAGIADKRWTKKRKKEIMNSRTEGTRFLVSQLKQHAPNCRTFIAASAIGFYGPDRNTPPFIETAAPYKDFLGETCVLWEKESRAAAEFSRTVIFRFGIVMGKNGGAYPQFAKPISFGIMPIIGSGRQIISWIHVDDLRGLICFALEHDHINGVYNAVAPEPVSQKNLVKTIAHTKGGFKIPAKVPATMLKLMLGEVSSELLKSCTVSGEKILQEGFLFSYPKIDLAVRSIMSDHS